MPFSRRAPANDQLVVVLERVVDLLGRRARCRAARSPVIRLARLTGRPYQSPARGSARPQATPGAQQREVLALASRRLDQLSAASSTGAGSGPTSIAASPIIFTSRTGGSTDARRRARRGGR